MRSFLLFILLTVLPGTLFCQSLTGSQAAVLDKLFKGIMAARDDVERLRLNDSVNLLVGQYASRPSVIGTRIEGLRNLGQVSSPDGKIMIISWNLVLRNSPGKYFCYIIRKGEDGSADRVTYLTRDYMSEQIRTDTVYSETDWYGALYYDIKPFFTDNRQCWVVLGINLSDLMATRKIIDVLSFTPEGRLVFGRKWFDNGSSISYRHLLEYSSSAVVSLRFMPDSSIVFDHLVPLNPAPGDERIYFAPDYSYDAFIYSDRLWNFSRNIDARNPEH